MKKLAFLLLVCFISCLDVAYAGRFEVTIINDIKDEEDPIRVKAVNFSIGQVEQISHWEGEEIGKEFKVKVNLPSIQHVFLHEYVQSIEAMGQELDSITLGNGTRKFIFTLLLGHGICLNPTVKDNINVSYLPSNKGFHIY